jgi:rare lipoprotein A
MKRVMLALLGLLLAVGLTAQDRTFRIERGSATQEMQAGGLSAAHSSIPVGSKVRVTNPANGLDIEVTIIGQIPESTRRIIDLSPGAALALDLGTGGPVMVTPTSIAQSNGGGKASSETGTGTESEKPPMPYNITINNNYHTNPDKPAQAAPVPQVAPVPQAAPVPVMPEPPQAVPAPAPQVTTRPQDDPIPQQVFMPVSPDPSPAEIEDRQERPTRKNRAGNEPNPSRYGDGSRENPYIVTDWYQVQPIQPVQPSAPPPLYTSPPVKIRIMPGLPDPHSNKLFRLFIGDYKGVDNASRVYQQLLAAGFDPQMEQAGDMCRVYAVNVPASMVYYAAERLGAIGFEQVWIYEL